MEKKIDFSSFVCCYGDDEGDERERKNLNSLTKKENKRRKENFF